MALTDIKIKHAKPKEREYKLTDGSGLHLLVTPAGGRLWRFKYRFNGSEKKLPLGKYPDVTIALARRERDAARALLATGADPSAKRREQRAAEKVAAGITFAAVSQECIDKAEREQRSPATLVKLRWARAALLPAIGHRPIADIKPIELLPVLKKMESKGKLETAKRTRSFASRVFRYAVATGRAEGDPASLLKGAIAAPKATHFAAIVEPKRVGELLRAIDGYGGQPSTRLALALAPHVFVRPGELRQAEWTEFDLDKAVWRIPAARMKQRREHQVPMSVQASTILHAARELSGGGRLVFPGLGKPDRPLSENTVNQALRRMGFGADEMTAHGFRTVASTLLNESGKWSPDAIERALSHKDNDAVRGSYNRGAYWAERVAMAQWWSDHLDMLRDGATVLPFRASS